MNKGYSKDDSLPILKISPKISPKLLPNSLFLSNLPNKEYPIKATEIDTCIRFE